MELENESDNRKVRFKIRRVGKNRDTDTLFQEFSFYSTSVFDFLSPNESKTKVLHAIEGDNNIEIEKSFNQYDSKIIALASEYPKVQLISDEKEKNKAALQFLNDLNKAREECLTSLLPKIKIMDGEYKLTIDLKYKSLPERNFWVISRLFRNKVMCIKVVKAITLANANDKIKNELNTLLSQKANNLLLGEDKEIIWPAVIPSKIDDK